MRTSRFKVTASNRDSYQYTRFRVSPIKTKSGRKTRRNFKTRTENANDSYGFRESSRRYPIKYMAYKVVRDDTHKVAVRKRVAKNHKKRKR